ncbi:MAG: LysR substrate-binding domain-containing protein [Thermodesulfobacteriota bacterium]
MELIQLFSFYQIVNTGSFSEASKKVFRSQPTISHQIKNLEKELGVKLFNRLGRKLVLTEEGRMLFKTIGNFFTDLENLKKRFEDIRQANAGNLTIASTEPIMSYLLPDCVRDFDKSFPKVKLKLIHCSITEDLIPLVLKGNIDLGIGHKYDRELLGQIGFLLWKTFDRVLLIPKNHPLSKKKCIELVDIASYPLVLYRNGSITRRFVEDTFIKGKLSCEIKMEMDSAENIKKYVAMGVGISVVSSLSVDEKDRDKLIFINVSNLFGKTDYGIYYRKDKYITAAMKEFMRVMDTELLDKLGQSPFSVPFGGTPSP